MRPGNRATVKALGVIGLVFAGSLLGRGQYSASENAGMIQDVPGQRHPGFGSVTETDPLFEAKRIKALNADRQKSMVSDTEKLVKLARKLDAEIASNPTGDLTSEELRQVADIEKLARNVKDKMARSFDVGPKVGSSFPPLPGPNLR